MVAVPCMICYTWLYNKQAQLTKAIDDSVIKTLNQIKKLSK